MAEKAAAAAKVRSRKVSPAAKRNRADKNSLDKLGFITSKSLY